MAVSHQSGTILHHWNDAPAKLIVKNKSTVSSTTSFGIPTPPATPSVETGRDALISGLGSLLEMENGLGGRNREMVFARLRALMRSIEEGKVSGIYPGMERCKAEVLLRTVVYCRISVRWS